MSLSRRARLSLLACVVMACSPLAAHAQSSWSHSVPSSSDDSSMRVLSQAQTPGTSARTRPYRPVDPQCVGPASFCQIYFGAR